MQVVVRNKKVEKCSKIYSVIFCGMLEFLEACQNCYIQNYESDQLSPPPVTKRRQQTQEDKKIVNVFIARNQLTD